MNWFKRSRLYLTTVVTALLCVAAPMTFTGCTTKLAPDGVYQGDKSLYNADKSIVESYDILHAFVKFEYDNREALEKYPDVRKAADEVRKNAEKWTQSAIAARDAYANSPTPQNRNSLSDATRVLREALTQAQRYVKAGVPK